MAPDNDPCVPDDVDPPGCAVAFFLIVVSIGAALAYRLFRWISGV